MPWWLNRETHTQVLRLLHRMWDTSGHLFVEPYEMRPVRIPVPLFLVTRSERGFPLATAIRLLNPPAKR